MLGVNGDGSTYDDFPVFDMLILGPIVDEVGGDAQDNGRAGPLHEADQQSDRTKDC
jgi:hypothetical protein